MVTSTETELRPPDVADPRPEGADLLDKVLLALRKYIIFPSDDDAIAVTLWIAATHAQPAWEHAPRLAAVSPAKRCGKSRLMDIVELLVHQPLITVNISPAALVRSIGRDDPPTIMLDEADTVFGKKAVADTHEDLRGLLNAGHQRNRPYIRWDMIKREPESCATFSMAMLAGIGDLPDTIMDRAVVIRMRRRAPGETVANFRTRRDTPALHKLRTELNTWVRRVISQLAAHEPKMPVEDRQADTWTPLVSIADAASGEWPERARKTVLAMCAAAETEEQTIGQRLLEDIRTIFGESPNMHTSTLIEALHKIEDGPWADWYGKPFSANDLAKRLREYGVKSAFVRVDGTQRKGWRREDLDDVWLRYLPAASAERAVEKVNGHAQPELLVEDPPSLFEQPELSANGSGEPGSIFDWTDVDEASDDEPWIDPDL